MTIGPEFARRLLDAAGWRRDYTALESVDKCVVIGAPHTSNWDFPIGLLAGIESGIPLRWLGKASIFRPPVRGAVSATRWDSYRAVSGA